MVIEDGIIGVSHLRLPAAQAHSTGLFTGKVVLMFHRYLLSDSGIRKELREKSATDSLVFRGYGIISYEIKNTCIKT